MRPLSMILALGENGALGRGGKLPWSYPEDRARFDAVTAGHVVIMGRRTWEEEGKPLAGRTTIVVSRSIDVLPGASVVPSLDAALALGWSRDDEPFVIGGARLFMAALPRVTRIHLTVIPEAPEADVFFTLDRTGFVVVEDRAAEQGLRFLVLERQRPPLPSPSPSPTVS